MTPVPAAAIALDPVLALLVGALGASIVGLLGGLFAAWVQSRRDHRKWLREKQFAAYVDFVVLTADDADRPGIEAGERRRIMLDLDRATATIRLVGSEETYAAARRAALRYVGLGFDDGDPSDYYQLRDQVRDLLNEFVKASKKELHIRS